MGVIHGLDNELYMDCIKWNSQECAAPTEPHVILHRDYEHSVYAAALLNDHLEALQAAAKIRDYLVNWADDEIYVIQLFQKTLNLQSFLQDMDETIRENEADRELEMVKK